MTTAAPSGSTIAGASTEPAPNAVQRPAQNVVEGSRLLVGEVYTFGLAHTVPEDQQTNSRPVFLCADHEGAGLTFKGDALHGISRMVAHGSYSHANAATES